MSYTTIVGITDDSSSIDEHYSRSGSRSWLVQSSTDNTSHHVMADLIAAGLSIASPHPDDSRSLLKNLEVVQVAQEKGHDDDGVECFLWRATATYGAWDPLTHSATGSPLDIPVRFRLDPTNFEEIARVDVVTGNPITNTAFDEFDPPVVRDQLRAVLTVNRNEASVNLPLILQLANKVNNASWNGFDSKTLKVAPIRLPEKQWDQTSGTSYFPMEYVFEFNPDGWTAKTLNQGYRQLKSGKRAPILIDGSPATAPAFLDESGTYLEAPVDQGNIIILENDVYEPTDFGVFNLDDLLSS